MTAETIECSQYERKKTKVKKKSTKKTSSITNESCLVYYSWNKMQT